MIDEKKGLPFQVLNLSQGMQTPTVMESLSK